MDDHDSRSTQQAASFLVYNAELISESFGIKADNYSGILNYNFMKNDYLNEFTETLIKMQENLRDLLNEDINLPSTSYFVEKDKTLYLNFIDLDELNTEMNFENEIKVMNLSEDNVIAPIYLIPIDSSGNTDKYGELVFYKRLKSNFGSFLGNLNSLLENDEIVLDIESDILENIIKNFDSFPEAISEAEELLKSIKTEAAETNSSVEVN